MNDVITIFHGSNVVVEKPQILISGFYKDFGYGFEKPSGFWQSLNIQLIRSFSAPRNLWNQFLSIIVTAYDKCIFP